MNGQFEHSDNNQYFIDFASAAADETWGQILNSEQTITTLNVTLSGMQKRMRSAYTTTIIPEKTFDGSGVYAMLRRLEEKTGIKASPHMLRHYFANARRKDGWKLELISQALGHRNIETTMKYLNITDEELIEVSDAFYSKHQAMYGIQDLL